MNLVFHDIIGLNWKTLPKFMRFSHGWVARFVHSRKTLYDDSIIVTNSLRLCGVGSDFLILKLKGTKKHKRSEQTNFKLERKSNKIRKQRSKEHA
jgi:hypothetical protein